MKAILKYLTLFVLSLLVTMPSYAASAHTQQSLVEWIISESKHKIQRFSAEAIVKAVMKHAHKQNIDPFLIVSLIKHESGFNPVAKNRSGASGLMQVVPRWHKNKIAGRSISNIDVNVEVGTQILADCIKKFGAIKKSLRCYSGGAKSYTEKLAGSYKDIKRYDIAYRFEQELPISVTSAFDKPLEFLHGKPMDTVVAGI